MPKVQGTENDGKASHLTRALLEGRVTSWVPVVAASIAAITASVGYIVTNRAKRVETRQEMYARALLAVQLYKHLPYRIRRRTDSKPETRSQLGVLISAAECDLDYYMALL